jgi:hypothetical protein
MVVGPHTHPGARLDVCLLEPSHKHIERCLFFKLRADAQPL